MNPETELVIEHLRYCVKRGERPHMFTYQVLNERAQKEDPLIKQLQDTPCVYVED